MRRKIRTFFIMTVLLFMGAAASGCGNSATGKGVWAAGETFQMAPQPLTDQQREKIQAVLSPTGDGLVFTDEGFSYKNPKLSDADRAAPAHSEEEAIEKAEAFFRSLFLYHKFGSVPVLLKDSPEIRIGVCEKGVESIRYAGWHTMES